VSYRVQLFRQPEKEMDRLDRVAERRIRDRLKELALAPYDDRLSKPVRMTTERRSSRVGDWRIIYRVDDRDPVIFVMAIQHRSKAYGKK
jgi:mRNA interferase RelE/StbE